MILLCDGHHSALHRGAIAIRGEAPDRLVVERRHDPECAHVGATRFDRAAMRVQARSALVALGFTPAAARAAIDAAAARLGTDVSLEHLLRIAKGHSDSDT
jgi:Holliday junction resolvasome RuvABC DNA-binding subunit